MDRSTAAHTKPEVMKMEDLPLGFGMALAQHPEAMARFSALSEEEQQAIIDGTHAVRNIIFIYHKEKRCKEEQV